MKDEPIHLAVVMDHPAQQFTRGLQLLARADELSMRCYYWSVAQEVHDADFDRSISWDMDLLSGYPWEAPSRGQATWRQVHWFINKLRDTRPEVLVSYGWASIIARISIIYCIVTRTPLVLYGDSTWQHSSSERHRFIRSAALHILMRLCAGAVSTGTFNREFYIRFGMDPTHVWHGVCPADTDSFDIARAESDESRLGRSTTSLRIGFAGKLIPRKGADELLRAAALLPPTHNWSLTLIGVGPQMTELRTLAAELGLEDRVIFHGFANTSEMPKLLADLDIVVVPSRLDMRVLISIEAMAAGAAIVVSDATAVWGPGDLVEHGVTGLVYPSGDHVKLSNELCRLLVDRHLIETLRMNGSRRATDYSPEAFAGTLTLAVKQCINAKRVARSST